MPFFKLDDVENLDAYKKSRNASISRITEKPASFIYSKKHTFKQPQKKVLPIFIFENGRIDPNIIKAVKAGAGGPVTEGSCHRNQDDILIFELTKGDLDGFDMVSKFQIGDTVEKSEKDEAKPEAATKAAPTEPKPDEEEEENQDLKVRLINGLKKIRTADGKESIPFVACVAKPFYGVLFTRNAMEKIGPTHKKTLTELTQGTKFIIGNCLFENNAHTFVVDPVPGGLAKKLKLALKEFTGQTCKVRVRDSESKVVTDGDTDVDPEEEQVHAAATASPSQAEAMAAFKERLKALQPEILKAIAAKTPQGDEIKQRATEAGAHASKNDFAQANTLLDAVESLLKKAAAAPPPKARTPSAEPTSDGPPRDIKLSTYLSGRANLRSARESAEKELKRLQEAILAKCKDESFYREVESKSQRLLDFLAPIDDSVADKLDEAGRCTDPEQQQELNKKVRELIQKQLTGMRSHPLASFVEKNPFGKFIIKQPIEVTLSALDKQLA